MVPPARSQLTRRNALGLAGAACVSRPASAAPDPAASGSRGLNDFAMQRNHFYGVALDDGILATDTAYMDHVRSECGIVTGETAFKWAAIRPTQDRYDFTNADALMDYARPRALEVRGHTLLWHGGNPAWLADTLVPANAESLLTKHIETVAGHCRGKVMHWDVVNEVVWPQDKKPLALRDTLWSRAMGPAMLDVAFHACAEADPEPLRFINEYGLDYNWVEDNRKREATLTLLSDMKARGLPVQALGIQAHLDAYVKELDQTMLAKFCSDVASMGLKIVITELDVRDNRLPGDLAVRDAAVASHARAYLDAMLSCPAVLGVLTWGLSDRRSWLNDELPREDKLLQRALPLDSDLHRKPLWSAIAAAFNHAPLRA